MTVSELIKQLQDRFELYGNMEVSFRDCLDDSDRPVQSVFYDDDTDTIMVSDIKDPLA